MCMGILWFLTTETHIQCCLSATESKRGDAIGATCGRQQNAVLRDLTQNNNSLGSAANATIASNQSAMTNAVPTAGDVRVTTRSVTWTCNPSWPWNE